MAVTERWPKKKKKSLSEVKVHKGETCVCVCERGSGAWV